MGVHSRPKTTTTTTKRTTADKTLAAYTIGSSSSSNAGMKTVLTSGDNIGVASTQKKTLLGL